MKYCRIIDGKVVEWGIDKQLILNRGHDLADYTAVKPANKPLIQDYQYVVEVTPDVSGSMPVQAWEVREKTLPMYKFEKIKELKDKFHELQDNPPPMDTGLGYKIDMGYRSLMDYAVAYELGVEQIRDWLNVSHPITPTEWQQILLTIKTLGLQMFQAKWDLEEQIMSIEVGTTYETTTDALIAIQNVGLGSIGSWLEERKEADRELAEVLAGNIGVSVDTVLGNTV
jgi:hypothetical protein